MGTRAFAAFYISIIIFSLVSIPLPVSAADIIAQQTDGSITGMGQSGCNNTCSDVHIASQVFTAGISAPLGAIEIFTENFHSLSRVPNNNTCYLSLYSNDAGALIASSDQSLPGYSCDGDVTFTFKDSQPELIRGNLYRWDFIFGAQNFSSISFFGSPADAVGGTFSVSPLINAKFTAFAALAKPAALFQSSASTSIPHGGIVDQSHITLGAHFSASSSASLRIQIELRPLYAAFTGQPNFESDFIPAGKDSTSSEIRISDLSNNPYHWQARMADADGNTSLWQPAGSPQGADPDFFISDPSTDAVLEDTSTEYSTFATAEGCSGDGTDFSCAPGPLFMHYATPSSFSISKMNLSWKNTGSNNCSGHGNFGAIITSSLDPATVVAKSANAIYMGCGGSGDDSTLNFSGETIPSKFYVTFGAFDHVLQGDSVIALSNIAIHGALADQEFSTSTILTTSTPPLDSRHPVVIVPGILGSRLERISDGRQIWPDADMLIASDSDSALDQLKLAHDGSEIPGNEMDSPDILRTITTSVPFASQNFYEPLIRHLETQGYREGIDIFVSPYDWRFSFESSTPALARVITEAINHSSDGKIDIIAHSMGGLLAESYLAATNTVSGFLNKLILVGVPQLGAPEMFKVLEYGDDLGFHIGPVELLNPTEMKLIAQNMPAAYNLLPSERYTNMQGGYIKEERGGKNNSLSFEETNNLLVSSPNDARNPQLLNRAESFHSINDSFPANAPSVYAIIGCQNPATAGGFTLEDGGLVKITRTSGDGTVPLASALNLASHYETYFSLYSENGANHLGLVSDEKSLSLINAILNNTTSTLDLRPLGISTSLQDCVEGRSSFYDATTIEIAAYGPVNIGAYDMQGRYTGASSTIPFVNREIPGSTYDAFDGNQSLLLPLSETYRIEATVRATGTLALNLSGYDGAVRPAGKSAYRSTLSATSTKIVFSVSSSTLTTPPALMVYDSGNATSGAIMPVADIPDSSSTEGVVSIASSSLSLSGGSAEHIPPSPTRLRICKKK